MNDSMASTRQRMWRAGSRDACTNKPSQNSERAVKGGRSVRRTWVMRLPTASGFLIFCLISSKCHKYMCASPSKLWG